MIQIQHLLTISRGAHTHTRACTRTLSLPHTRKHTHTLQTILTFFQLLSKSIFNEGLLHCTEAAGESQSSSRAAAGTDNQLQKMPKLFSHTGSIFLLAFELANKTDNFDNTYRLLIFAINFEFSVNQSRSGVFSYHYTLYKYLLKYLNTVNNSV